MLEANIVYWYSQSEMPRDGGGLRALAWQEALTALGYRVTIHPLRSVDQGVRRTSTLRDFKKSLIPMPLESGLPKLPRADLNVITVPAVFASAARTLPKSSLIFDWMDLWSVNARTMSKSSLSLRPGGYAQSLWWKYLESRLPHHAAGNAFAGHHDFLSLSRNAAGASAWLPTPVRLPAVEPTERTDEIRRVGFLGNMNYPPNVMSLRKFLTEYSDRMKSLGLELVVAGFGSEVVRTWGSEATVLGPLDNVADFYSNIDAVIVPIDHGGGIKVKAVEALVYGVPVFGTEHVRQGFGSAFRSYVGHVEDLMSDAMTLPARVPLAAVHDAFGEASFREGVKDLLARAGL
ncbi:glycosyltransferase family 4 protein [Paenarthrobacter nicotinovorans]|uniref:glycosyltransferase family 4 protein n=1 Tax=Paenarthrobacter nicotinovorans TaxID=29320 RepID=UPI003749099D